MLLTRAPLYLLPEGSFHVRLACVKHTANVRSEPGSNSPVENCISWYCLFTLWFVLWPANHFTSVCYSVFKDPAKHLRRRCDRRVRISKPKCSVNCYLRVFRFFFARSCGSFYLDCQTSERWLYRLSSGLSRAFSAFFALPFWSATRGEFNKDGAKSQGFSAGFLKKRLSHLKRLILIKK